MLKLSGCLFIIICSTMIGFSLSSDFKKHLNYINRIIAMLHEIEIMINYKHMTTSELITYISQCNEFKIFEFLSYENKNKIIDNINNEKILYENEKTQLQIFFKKLGTTDINGQISIVKQCSEKFKEYKNTYEKVLDNKCKLYNSFGFLIGAFIAVIII